MQSFFVGWRTEPAIQARQLVALRLPTWVDAVYLLLLRQLDDALQEEISICTSRVQIHLAGRASKQAGLTGKDAECTQELNAG